MPDEVAEAVAFLASDKRRLHHRHQPLGERRPAHVRLRPARPAGQGRPAGRPVLFVRRPAGFAPGLLDFAPSPPQGAPRRHGGSLGLPFRFLAACAAARLSRRARPAASGLSREERARRPSTAPSVDDPYRALENLKDPAGRRLDEGARGPRRMPRCDGADGLRRTAQGARGGARQRHGRGRGRRAAASRTATSSSPAAAPKDNTLQALSCAGPDGKEKPRRGPGRLAEGDRQAARDQLLLPLPRRPPRRPRRLRLRLGGRLDPRDRDGDAQARRQAHRPRASMPGYTPASAGCRTASRSSTCACRRLAAGRARPRNATRTCGCGCTRVGTDAAKDVARRSAPACRRECRCRRRSRPS